MQKAIIMQNLTTTFTRNVILMMGLFLSITMISSCDDDEMMMVDPDPSNVVPSFTSQVDPDNSLTYAFTNNSLVNGIDDTSFESSWDFGGDGTSTEANPTYTFSGEGTFVVTLTVTATDGETGTATATIDVTAPRNRYVVE